MDISQFLDAFLAESEDNLTALNDYCLQLEQRGAEDDIFAAMFRAAHTLKGMSATMGFTKMAELTHHMEDTLGHVRSHPEIFQPVIVDILLEAVDALTLNLQSIRDQGSDAHLDHAAIVSRLAAVVKGTVSPSTSSSVATGLSSDIYAKLAELERGGYAVGVIEVLLDKGCVMKGVRMVMIMKAIEELGDSLACFPESRRLEEGEFEGPVQIAIVTRGEALEEVTAAVADISEVESVRIVDWKTEAATQLSQATNEVAASTASVVEVDAPPTVGSDAPQAGPSSANHATGGGRGREQTLRVPVSRIDDFMNVLSELVIARTRLDMLAQQHGDPALKEVSEQIGRLSEGLQDGVMNMRMMPVESLFQRFPRMMRDLQKSLDREFDFEMSGLETEMDRTVMDEMGEALVHLLRNAADHGLESPAAREQAGKPRRGKISLSAYATGGHVYLEVRDDGGGIDRNRVLNSALKKGIVSAADAERMTDEQVHELLFASGFSTAQTVSDISGRGVGLDAVRGKVNSMGGEIRIESSLGVGTTFIIELPLTLTILPAMLVRVGDELFAVPTSSVEEVAHVNETDLEWVREHPVVKFRDKIVPIVDLGEKFFNRDSRGTHPWNAVICREGKQYVAFTVDEIVEELEVVNKPLGRYLAHVKMFSGATILGDGQVALIIDVREVSQLTA